MVAFGKETDYERGREVRGEVAEGVMGLIRGGFSFIAGTVCGIYIAQNYNVPNIRKLTNEFLFRAKEVEEKYRKPKKPGDDV